MADREGPTPPGQAFRLVKVARLKRLSRRVGGSHSVAISTRCGPLRLSMNTLQAITICINYSRMAIRNPPIKPGWRIIHFIMIRIA